MSKIKIKKFRISSKEIESKLRIPLPDKTEKVMGDRRTKRSKVSKARRWREEYDELDDSLDSKYKEYEEMFERER